VTNQVPANVTYRATQHRIQDDTGKQQYGSGVDFHQGDVKFENIAGELVVYQNGNQILPPSKEILTVPQKTESIFDDFKGKNVEEIIGSENILQHVNKFVVKRNNVALAKITKNGLADPYMSHDFKTWLTYVRTEIGKIQTNDNIQQPKSSWKNLRTADGKPI